MTFFYAAVSQCRDNGGITPNNLFFNVLCMENQELFEVVVIGGSCAGLAGALTLGATAGAAP